MYVILYNSTQTVWTAFIFQTTFAQTLFKHSPLSQTSYSMVAFSVEFRGARQRKKYIESMLNG